MPDSAEKAEAYAAIDYPREAAEVAAKLVRGRPVGLSCGGCLVLGGAAWGGHAHMRPSP